MFKNTFTFSETCYTIHSLVLQDHYLKNQKYNHNIMLKQMLGGMDYKFPLSIPDVPALSLLSNSLSILTLMLLLLHNLNNFI